MKKKFWIGLVVALALVVTAQHGATDQQLADGGIGWIVKPQRDGGIGW